MNQEPQGEEFQQDWYGILDCDKDSTAEQIEKASRRLSFKYHPDKNKDADAPALFLLVQKAKNILLDPVKRKLIDDETKRKADIIARKSKQDERMDKNRKRMRDQFEDNLKKAAEPKLSHEQLMKNEIQKREKIIEELARKNAAIIEQHAETNQYQQFMKRHEFENIKRSLQKEDGSATCQIKVKWLRKANPYTKEALESLFGIHGKINNVKFSEGKAVLTYAGESFAKAAFDAYQWNTGVFQVTLVADKKKSSSSSYDYKASDDIALRQAVNNAVGLEALNKLLEECRAKQVFGMSPPPYIEVQVDEGGGRYRTAQVKQFSVSDCMIDPAMFANEEAEMLRKLKELSSVIARFCWFEW